MTRYILVVLLLGHGGIVAAQAGGVPHSWLVGDSHGLGIMLALAAGAVFLLAAVELWMRAARWRALAVTAAAVSLCFFLVFFQPVILLGVAFDAAVIVALVWLRWPSPSTAGA
jgi:hypothetical protein